MAADENYIVDDRFSDEGYDEVTLAEFYEMCVEQEWGRPDLVRVEGGYALKGRAFAGP